MKLSKRQSRVEPIYALIGAEVRRRRILAGISQQRMADILGVTRTSITNFEAGRQRMPLHLIDVAALVLGVSLGKVIERI
ncbi:MAG: helix-turn-helix transcriptional regulator [Patescibacteria group bacterium]|nr:helix-turn-helix transcriptional regulator [Patescibacteria group bacterium]